MVSVIIPVFNSEKYLKNCLDSVLNQTYSDIEVILVDDGSSDESLSICKGYEHADGRVRVISQENTGVVKARKSGLMAARGEKVCFIDSDDVIKETMIENLMMYSAGVDLVTSGCIREEHDGTETLRQDGLKPGLYATYEDMRYVRNNMIYVGTAHKQEGILPYLVAKLYSRDVLVKLLDEVEINLYIDEDRAINMCYLLNCKSIYITNNAEYIYRYRAESVMHSEQPEYLSNLNKYYLIVKEYFEKKMCDRELMLKLQKFISDRLYSATKFMGFEWNERVIKFSFQMENLQPDAKVVLYGAGVVGCDYYRQLLHILTQEQISWTDGNWEQLVHKNSLVKSLDDINLEKQDLIIIAVKSKSVADEITDKLVALKVPRNKIWWEKPIDLSAL